MEDVITCGQRPLVNSFLATINVVNFGNITRISTRIRLVNDFQDNEPLDLLGDKDVKDFLLFNDIKNT